jgi:hypothetical protein
MDLLHGFEVIIGIGSLGSREIGDAGARDLGAALRVNTTLTKL